MKFLTVFVALLSVAFGYQSSWTLQQLDKAISNPNTDPNLVPYLEAALNEIMAAMFDGHHVTAVTVTIPAMDLSAWTLPELSAAIENPTTDPALLPYLEQALNHIMESMVSGMPVVAVPVVVPAMEVSSWTLPELSAALENPNTKPELIPYLEHALNELMDALVTGNQIDSVVVAIPVGIVDAVPVHPIESPKPVPVSPIFPVESPKPVPVSPIFPVESPKPVPVSPIFPVEDPVAAPVAAPAANSPLVQIIVNVNQKNAPVAPVVPVSPIPVAEEKPESVVIVDGPAPILPVKPIKPVVDPINVIDVSPVVVDPVHVVDVNPIVVDPVNVIDVGPIVDPINVVEVGPVVVDPVNVVEVGPVVVDPINIIGVNPVVNPIEILNPAPAVMPVVVGTPVIGPVA